MPTLGSPAPPHFCQTWLQTQESQCLPLRYYGDYIDAHPKTEIVVLTTEELDDDNLIAFLEEKPAYKRNVKDVQQIRSSGNVIASSQQKKVSSSAIMSQGQKPKGGTIISF